MATMSALPPPTAPVDVDKYFKLPVTGPRTELVFGEVIEMPAPSISHNDLLHDLGHILSRWVRHHTLGRICFDNDLVLDESAALVYRPDLQYLTVEQCSQIRNGRVYGCPELLIEILSPSDYPRHLARKLDHYRDHGIRWVWLFHHEDPNPRIQELELLEGKFQERSVAAADEWFEPAVFPGLRLKLRPLLAGDQKSAVQGKASDLI